MGSSITIRPQESQGQGHGSKVKGHSTKIGIIVTLASIPWTQHHPQDSQVQGHS